jgi:type I restriction enzyme R subunit
VNLYETMAAVSDMKPVVVNPQISFTQLMGELETVSAPDQVQTVVDQILAKLQRKRRHLSESSQEILESIAGWPLDEMVQHLKQSSPGEAAAWLKSRTMPTSYGGWSEAMGFRNLG